MESIKSIGRVKVKNLSAEIMSQHEKLSDEENKTTKIKEDKKTTNDKK